MPGNQVRMHLAHEKRNPRKPGRDTLGAVSGISGHDFADLPAVGRSKVSGVMIFISVIVRRHLAGQLMLAQVAQNDYEGMVGWRERGGAWRGKLPDRAAVGEPGDRRFPLP